MTRWLQRICDSRCPSCPKLKKLLVVYRHGDRAPLYPPFPTDPNRNYVWTDGSGHLTNVGRSQALALGSYLRSHYREFLTLKPTEVVARSSPVLRCIKTTGCVLNGIYNPTDTTNCYKDTGFTAVPIYTVNPENYDHMLYYGPTCSKYSLFFYNTLSSPAYLQTTARYNSVVQKLEKLTGLSNLTYNDVPKVYDTLVVEEAHNLTISNWVPGLMPEMKEITLNFFNARSQYKDGARLRSGFLLNDLIIRMTEDCPSKKLYLYGTHRTMLMPLMKLMQVFNDLLIPYAAAIIIEVNSRRRRHFIDIFYRNSSSVAPYKLTIRGCSDPCSVQDFKRLTKDLVVVNPKKACQVGDVSSLLLKNLMVNCC